MAFQVFDFGKRLGLVGPGAEAAAAAAEWVVGGGPVTVSGKTVVVWPPDGCDPGAATIISKERTQGSPLESGYDLITMGCPPPHSGRGGGGGSAEGPVGYGRMPDTLTERYPLSEKEFERQTNAPPSSEEIEKLINTCPDGSKAGCCDDFSRKEIAQTIRNFFDKQASILRKYPPYVYNCLLEAFRRLEKIGCYVQKDMNASMEYELSVDGRKLSIGDLTAEQGVYRALYNALTTIINRFGVGEEECEGLGDFFFAVVGFEGPSMGDSSTHEWINEWCKIRRRESKKTDNPFAHTTPNTMIIIDLRTGTAYSNPFWPDLPPMNWKPDEKNELYNDSRLKCL